MTNRVLRALTGLLFLLPLACGGADNANPTLAVDIPFERYSLANGLEVILHKNDRVPVASVNLWYHVGPANERASETGFAHLFEHMMLRGSGHVKEPSKLLEARGASAFDGNTDFDRTNYFEDVPSNELEFALWLESDRMGFLLDVLDQPSLSNQQDVVRNERRQTRETPAYAQAQEHVYRLLFPKGHPYNGNVIGTHEQIQAMNLEDVRSFFARFYGPNNATLAIAGNIDTRKAKRLVEKYFGGIKAGPDVRKPKIHAPRITSERREALTDNVELPRLYMAWVTPGAYRPGNSEAALTAGMLGHGRASRLYRRLVYRKQIAESVSATHRSLGGGSVFQIQATAKPGHTLEELELEIEKELSSLADKGPSKQELNATKAGTVTTILKSLETTGGVADRLNSYNHYLDEPDFLKQDVARYSNVGVRAIKDFVKKELAAGKRVVVTVQPGPKVLPPEPPAVESEAAVPATPPAAAEPWRNQAPRSGVAPRVKLPKAIRFELDNGLEVQFSESHGLPLVTAYLAARSGTVLDPPELPGLSAFSTALLDEGAGNKDAAELADDVTQLGAILKTGAAKEESWVFAQSQIKEFPAALDLMKDVVRSPAFSPQDVERVRRDRLADLLRQRDDPSTTAYKVMWREMYGPGHPYGHLALGSEEAIKAITLEELKRAWEQSFTPQNSALILAGDMTRSQAKTLTSKAFGSWRGPRAEAPAIPSPSPAQERVFVVDKPGSPQTTLVFAQQGLPRLDPDFEKVELLQQILGGLFSSRLNLNLRETNGFTYRVNSEVSRTRGPGPILVSASTQTQVTGAAIREVLGEIDKLKQTGVTEEELERARDATVRSLPALFQTSESTARSFAGLYLMGLPVDHYSDLGARLEKIDSKELAAAAQKYLQPDQIKVVAVGDRKEIDSQLQSLRLGSVGYRGPDGLSEQESG